MYQVQNKKENGECKSIQQEDLWQLLGAFENSKNSGIVVSILLGGWQSTILGGNLFSKFLQHQHFNSGNNPFCAKKLQTVGRLRLLRLCSVIMCAL